MLAFFNKFNKFLGDMNKCNNSNDDNNIYCNIHNRIVINNCTKGEEKTHILNPGITSCSFVQPQYLVYKIQRENDPSSLFKRIFTLVPHVEVSNLDESKIVGH